MKRLLFSSVAPVSLTIDRLLSMTKMLIKHYSPHSMKDKAQCRNSSHTSDLINKSPVNHLLEKSDCDLSGFAIILEACLDNFDYNRFNWDHQKKRKTRLYTSVLDCFKPCNKHNLINNDANISFVMKSIFSQRYTICTNYVLRCGFGWNCLFRICHMQMLLFIIDRIMSIQLEWNINKTSIDDIDKFESNAILYRQNVSYRHWKYRQWYAIKWHPISLK